MRLELQSCSNPCCKSSGLEDALARNTEYTIHSRIRPAAMTKTVIRLSINRSARRRLSCHVRQSNVCSESRTLPCCLHVLSPTKGWYALIVVLPRITHERAYYRNSIRRSRLKTKRMRSPKLVNTDRFRSKNCESDVTSYSDARALRDQRNENVA